MTPYSSLDLLLLVGLIISIPILPSCLETSLEIPESHCSNSLILSFFSYAFNNHSNWVWMPVRIVIIIIIIVLCHLFIFKASRKINSLSCSINPQKKMILLILWNKDYGKKVISNFFVVCVPKEIEKIFILIFHFYNLLWLDRFLVEYSSQTVHTLLLVLLKEFLQLAIIQVAFVNHQ